LRARHAEAVEEEGQLAKAPDDLESRKKALFDEIIQAETGMRWLTVLQRQKMPRRSLTAQRQMPYRRPPSVKGASNAAIEPRRADIEARIAEALACPAA